MKIMETLILVMILWCLYVVFVWGPVALYAEAKCLEQGYPEYKVTVGLEKYCLNLDGTITVAVDKL